MQKSKSVVKPIETILRGHRVAAFVHGFGNSTKVHVSWPDLTPYEIQPTGAWGKSYTVKTNNKAEVCFSYQLADESSARSQSRSNPDQIAIESPILAGEREKTPWFIDFKDQEFGVVVRCNFDPSGLPHSTSVHLLGSVQSRLRGVAS